METSNTAPSSIISRVQKLLNLSKSVANLNEAENAARAANKLIEEYRLSFSDLETNDPSTIEGVVEDDGYIYETGRVIPWKQSLVMAIASQYGVALINDTASSEKGRKISRFKLFGRA